MADILSHVSRQQMKVVVLYADEHWALGACAFLASHECYSAKFFSDGHDISIGMDKYFSLVDWKDRESVLPFVQFFEKAIGRGKTFAVFENVLQQVLSHDGYRIKEGKLVRVRK